MKTKKRKNKKNTHRKTQKAGIRVINNISHDKAFKYFIENSTFSYYSEGFFGILILAKLKDGIKSPYRHIRTNNIGQVKQLLIKFFKIKSSTDTDVKQIDLNYIRREINTQQSIYISSLRNPDTLLEPICPCIVYSEIEPLNKNYKKSFYNIISQNIQNNKNIDELFQEDVVFFAMEFMENYLPLSKYINTYLETVSVIKSLYILDKLHSYGFMHNDFHNGNILLVKKYNYFGFEKDDSNGRAIIIDFGEVTQIEHTEEINDIYRLELLQKESKHVQQGLFLFFRLLDEQHKIVQKRYISVIENYYKCDINRLINSFNIYIGGNMSILESKFDTIKNKNINKNINKNSLADEAEEELKRVNPEKYKELMDSIKETLEEEKQNPGYIKNLFSNQMNGLIDPAFRLPDNTINENTNKLTLMMDG